MTETLYLDLFFLVNLSADMYLLLLTGLVLREPLRTRKMRLFLGAAVGAAAGCGLVFVPKLPLPVWLLLELVLPVLLMTRIAFGRCSFPELLQRITVLWMAAVLTGGVFAGLESVGSVSHYPAGSLSGAWALTPWTFRRFGVGLCAAGGILLAGSMFLRQRLIFRNSLYEVTLHYQGKQKNVRALRDTGNQLYEPYGRQPVHILEQSACRAFDGPVSEVIYVPFCSVGREHGFLAAIRMDRMEIWQQGRQIRVVEHPWVAISKMPLSQRHQYEMLLHGEL